MQAFRRVFVTRSGGITRCFHHDKNSSAQYCAARKLSNGAVSSEAPDCFAMVHFAYQRSSQRAGTLPIIQSRLRHSLTEFKLRVHLLDAHSKRVDLPLQARNCRFGLVPRSSDQTPHRAVATGVGAPLCRSFSMTFGTTSIGAIDLRLSVEPAKRKTQTPPGIIAGRIHCAQYVRSFL